MSVVAEFTIAEADFPLGQALRTVEGVTVSLDRIVPLEGTHMPYVWVHGGDLGGFEEQVRTDRFVKDFAKLDQVGSKALYRIEWTETEHGLLNGIQETQAAIMEAEGTDKWGFRLRFLNHQRLTTFHDYCLDNDLEIELGRVFTPSEPGSSREMYDLTPAQREALAMAVDRGYFSSPREVSLSELATELSISKQAVSQRIRRANEKVLRGNLSPIGQ
jgi:predicted DNA binding protein